VQQSINWQIFSSNDRNTVIEQLKTVISDNVFETDGIVYDYSYIQRNRQFYLSLDIDLTRIKTKSKFANTVLGAFGFIKFPFPAIEFNQNGKTQFKGLYF